MTRTRERLDASVGGPNRRGSQVRRAEPAGAIPGDQPQPVVQRIARCDERLPTSTGGPAMHAGALADHRRHLDGCPTARLAQLHGVLQRDMPWCAQRWQARARASNCRGTALDSSWRMACDGRPRRRPPSRGTETQPEARRGCDAQDPAVGTGGQARCCERVELTLRVGTQGSTQV